MEGSDAGRVGHLEDEDEAFLGFRSSYEKPARADGGIERPDGSIVYGSFSQKIEEVMGEDY